MAAAVADKRHCGTGLVVEQLGQLPPLVHSVGEVVVADDGVDDGLLVVIGEVGEAGARRFEDAE